MPLPKHLKPVVEAVLRASCSLPAPWRVSGIQSVGGLTDVGFVSGTDFLLVCPVRVEAFTIVLQVSE